MLPNMLVKNLEESEMSFHFPMKFGKQSHKNKKIKKLKVSKKKLKREPSLKKLGNFTVVEGHGHPLVILDCGKSQSYGIKV